MSVCNRMTLAQFSQLAPREEETLAVDQIALLLDEVAAKAARIKALQVKLDDILARRYGSAARQLRELGHEATDIVTLRDGDFIVTTHLPRDVKWDQKKLAKLAEIIFHDWERDPEDYINISYTVEEQNYLTWPSDTRKHFDDARTLDAGKPVFGITAVKRAKRKKGVP